MNKKFGQKWQKLSLNWDKQKAIPSSLLLILAFGLQYWSCTDISNPQKIQQAAEKQLNWITKHLVQIKVTTQEPNYAFPWQAGNIKSHFQQGIYIEINKKAYVLTSADGLLDTKSIFVRDFGMGEFKKAFVHAIDHPLGLALLNADGKQSKKEQKTENAQPADPISKRNLQTYKKFDPFDNFFIANAIYNAKLELIPASFGSLKVSSSETSYAATSTFVFQSSTDALSRGTPILADNQLAGIVISSSNSQITSIPYFAIQTFLDNVRLGKPGSGYFNAGLSRFVSPADKSYYKSRSINEGLLISHVFDDSITADTLAVGDILWEVDGNTISDTGYYEDKVFSRTYYQKIINQLMAGDILKGVKERKGEKSAFSLTLPAYGNNKFPIPFNLEAPESNYLLAGGLVIVPLTRQFLTTWGKKWKKKAPPELMKIYEFDNSFHPQNNKQVLIVTQVLNHNYTMGFEAFKYQVIESVSGNPVSNIESLKAILEREENWIFKFKDHDLHLPLLKEGRAEATADMVTTFKVPKKSNTIL